MPEPTCMERHVRRRVAAAAGLGVVVVGSCVSFAAADTSRRAPAAPPPLRLERPHPKWLVPGAAFRVTGWACAEETVRLLAGGREVGRAQSGPMGRFVIEARAPRRAAAYPLALASAERQRHLRTLVVRPLVLAAVGDVNLGDQIADAISANGPAYPWSGVRALLREADLAIANLECAVSTGGAPVPGKEYTFRGSPGALPAVAEAGIDVLSLANNHSLDFGREALLDTVRHVRRNGIATVGGGRDLAAARRPARFELGGLRIAVLAYSDVRPYGFDAGPGLPGAAPAFSELIDPDVRKARRTADVVVVYFHWGTELATTPDARQRSLADVALRAGATVVLGAHPHVLQPVQRGGRKLVAWSLGNFVFGAHSAGTTSTGVLLTRLNAHGVSQAQLVPARIAGVRPALDARYAAIARARIGAERAPATLTLR